MTARKISEINGADGWFRERIEFIFDRDRFTRYLVPPLSKSRDKGASEFLPPKQVNSGQYSLSALGSGLFNLEFSRRAKFARVQELKDIHVREVMIQETGELAIEFIVRDQDVRELQFYCRPGVPMKALLVGLPLTS